MLQISEFNYGRLLNYLAQGKNPGYRKIGNNTIIHVIEGDCIAVKFHNTDIAKIYRDNRIELYASGFLTFTTKERLNEIIPRPYRIYQDTGIWHVWNYAIQAEIGLFQDGLTILPDGSISGFADNRELDKQTKLRRKANKYVEKYVNALFAGKVDKPGIGDCLFCQFRDTESGKSIGECFKDQDHILSHISENYYVPSLLYNALETYQVSHVAMWVMTSFWYPDSVDNPKDTIETFQDIARDQIKKSLRKYIYSQLDLPH